MLNYYSLQRDVDVSGCSGTGQVAHVFELPDSAAMLVWDKKNILGVQSVVVYENKEDLLKVHGHDGKSFLVPQSIDEVDLSEVFAAVDKAHEFFMVISDLLFEVEHGGFEEEE